MYGHTAVELATGAGLLVVYFNARLLLEARQVLIERTFETDFVQDHRMQRVRQGAHFVEGGLHDLLHLAQVGAARVGVGRTPAGPLQPASAPAEDLAQTPVP